MRIVRLPQFKRMWQKLSPAARDKGEKALRLLLTDRAHPSRRLKRFQRLPALWEVRVDDDYRILCTLSEDAIVLVAIGRHQVLDRFEG